MINLTFFILFFISEHGVRINMMSHDITQYHIKAVAVTQSYNHVS